MMGHPLLWVWIAVILVTRVSAAEVPGEMARCDGWAVDKSKRCSEDQGLLSRYAWSCQPSITPSLKGCGEKLDVVTDKTNLHRERRLDSHQLRPCRPVGGDVTRVDPSR